MPRKLRLFWRIVDFDGQTHDYNRRGYLGEWIETLWPHIRFACDASQRYGWPLPRTVRIVLDYHPAVPPALKTFPLAEIVAAIRKRNRKLARHFPAGRAWTTRRR